MEGFISLQIGSYTVVEFQSASLMDLQTLEDLAEKLYRLIDQEDHRWILLDFSRVEYVSSQFLGILLTLQKRLAQKPGSRLVLCSVGPKLSELFRITKLDKILTIRSTQGAALAEK